MRELESSSRVPGGRAQGVPHQRIARADLEQVTRISTSTSKRGRPKARPTMCGSRTSPEDAVAEVVLFRPGGLRYGRARDHDQHLGRDLHDRLRPRLRRAQQGRDVRARLPHRRARVARAGEARCRHRVAALPDGPTIPLEEFDRAIDERTAVDGEPRPVPVERDRRREGGVPDRARARRAVVRGRLPRDRHRAARPLHSRVRYLRGRSR